MPGPIPIPCYMKQKIPFRALLIASKWDFLLHLAANAKKGRLPIYAKQPSAEYPAEGRGHRYATVGYTAARLDETYTALPKLTPNRMPSPSSLPRPPDPNGRVIGTEGPGAGPCLSMSSARTGGASGASVVSQDCSKLRGKALRPAPRFPFTRATFSATH